MSVNGTALKAAWTTIIEDAHDAGDLEDEEYYEALIALDTWIAALDKLTTASAENVASYSINNRSATRRGSEEFRQEVQSAKAELMRLLYGNVTLADFRRLETIDPGSNS